MKLNIKGIYFRFFHNWYALIITGFIVIVVFFDPNNTSFIDQYYYIKEINKMERDIEYYKNKIKEDGINLNELKSNNEFLEKYAREKYLMKRNNEDIFIIMPER